MRPSQESAIADTVLRLLLDPRAVADVDGEAQWAMLARIAAKNAVLIRLAERLEVAGQPLCPALDHLVLEARARARAMIHTVRAIAELCTAERIGCLFPKALQHLPDMGRDIDLLVLSTSPEVDARLQGALGAMPMPVDLRGRITGTTSYRLPGCPTDVDVQHGRLGVVGEHADYPARLVGRARPTLLGSTPIQVPSPEDQVVLQGMQRVYGRTTLRIADILSTLGLLRSPSLDWDYVMGTCRDLGIVASLSCYLSYVDQIHSQALDGPLPAPPAARALIGRGWGRIRFRGGAFGFPVARVHGRIYLQRLAADARWGRWRCLGRHAYMLPVAAAALFDRVVRRPRREVLPCAAPEAQPSL